MASAKTIDQFLDEEVTNEKQAVFTKDTTDAVDAFVNDLKSGKDSISSGGPKVPLRPTRWSDVPKRFLARGVFPEDSGRRESLLRSMGINPLQDIQSNTLNLLKPEPYADVAEMTAPISKYGMAAMGASAGSLVGAPASVATLNPAPSFAGAILGGAAGYMLADKAFRAAVGGYSTPASDVEAALIGGSFPITTRAIGNVPGIVKDLTTAFGGTKAGKSLVKAFEGLKSIGAWIKEHELTKVAKFSREELTQLEALDAPGRSWRFAVANKDLVGNRITDTIRDKVLPSINQYYDDIGVELRTAAGHIIDDPMNRIDFSSIAPKIVETLYDYTTGTGKLTKAEGEQLARMFQRFFPRTKGKMDKALPGKLSLRQAYDGLKTIDRQLAKFYAAAGEAKEALSPLVGATMRLRGMVTGFIKEAYPSIKEPFGVYEGKRVIWETALEHFGNATRAGNFVSNSLLSRHSTDVSANRAFQAIDAATIGKNKFRTNLMQNVAIEGLGKETSPSGFSAGIVPNLVGWGTGAVGAGIGGTVGGPAGAGAGAAIGYGAGRGISSLLQTPFLSRSHAAETLAKLEAFRDYRARVAGGVAKTFLSVPPMVRKTAAYRIMGKPVSDAIKDIYERFSIKVDADTLQ